MTGFSLLPHVLGPKYERRQRPRNSQKSSGQGGAGETWHRLARTPDVAVVTPLNNFLGPEGDTVTVE